MVTFSRPRVQLDKPTSEELSEIDRKSSPAKTSIVLTMGRALRGNLVSGIMEMKTLISIEKNLGYPSVPMRFDVISSLTSSPNISMPATAVAASNKYVNVKVIFTPLAYLCGCRMSL